MSGEILIKRMHVRAEIPERHYLGDAGLDLQVVEGKLLRKGAVETFKTGIGVALPAFTYGRVVERSSVARYGLGVLGGVIDRGFRGEIKIILANHGADDYFVRTGDRVAQLIVEAIHLPSIREVETLPPSTRGGFGFGSTGV